MKHTYLKPAESLAGSNGVTTVLVAGEVGVVRHRFREGRVVARRGRARTILNLVWLSIECIKLRLP